MLEAKAFWRPRKLADMMSLVATNTLSGKKEPFEPIEAGQVRMYVCGLTPYEEAHIGHARAYVAYDVMRRYLEHKGLQVRHIQNITDVDDRIIARAHETGEAPLSYAQRIHDLSVEAFQKLRIKAPHAYPKVSEHISGIIDMVQTLIDKGHAYTGADDHGTSVYFHVASDDDYGKLSHLNRDDMLEGVRKSVAGGKRDPHDFALWKASKPGESVAWDSPWGEGRPGWHIECSVMAKALLGDTLDIHGGGWDLVFPHHENEIAQSECANNSTFVRNWWHVGFLTVEGVKMSKSLGNFTTVEAALAEWPAEAMRLWFAGTHYRSPIDYSAAALAQARKNIERFDNMHHAATHALASARTDAPGSGDTAFLNLVDTRTAEFEAAMDDDFNTPKALSILFDITGEINKYLADPHHDTLTTALQRFGSLEAIFDIMPQEAGVQDVDELLDLLLEVRQMARKNKDFEASDLIRDRLNALGYSIEDAADGPRWRRQ